MQTRRWGFAVGEAIEDNVGVEGVYTCCLERAGDVRCSEAACPGAPE
jgi:hypothetical protein